MLIKNLVQLSHILNYSEDNVKVFDKFIIFTSVSCHWYQLKIITFCITAYVHCGHFLCSVISQGKVVALDRWGGKWSHLSTPHRLTTNYAKNYCNRTLIVKVLYKMLSHVVWGHSACILLYCLYFRLPTFTHLIKQIVQSSLYTKMTV